MLTACTNEVAQNPENLALAHPFAIALKEFFATETGGFTKAFFVNIDGGETRGVLAIKNDGIEMRLFALYGGELSYIDITQDIAVNITDQGRIMGSSWRGPETEYTLFGIEDGRVDVSFSIHAQLNLDILTDGPFNIYYYLADGAYPDKHITFRYIPNNANSIYITYEDFRDIVARYRLAWEHSSHWTEMADETEHILALTLATCTNEATQNASPTENMGLSSADVRMYLVDEGDIRLWYPDTYGLFDLSQIELYYEIELEPNGIRFVFTTESAVSDFRLLQIGWDEGYHIIDELLHLDELAPDLPLVVRWTILGCALAGNGFSFTNQNGITKYFGFLICGRTGMLQIFQFYPALAHAEAVLWSIEELGEIIVAAGTFWEEVWGDYIIGRFASEHVDNEAGPSRHLPFGMFFRVLPTSGFENLNDVRNYLLQFYTESWVDSTLANEAVPVQEHEGVLYVAQAGAGFARPGWWTASFELVKQEGNVAIVDATLYHGSWHRLRFGGEAYPYELTHRFIFVDGRIDNIPGNTYNWIFPGYFSGY
jgi:hypothetical protein